MDQQRLRELLDYDAETGRFVWRQANKRVKAGTVAGYVGNDGYVTPEAAHAAYIAAKRQIHEGCTL